MDVRRVFVVFVLQTYNSKFYIHKYHNNTFYTVIFKTRVNLTHLKEYYYLQHIEPFIDTFIKKQVMTIFKLYIFCTF